MNNATTTKQAKRLAAMQPTTMIRPKFYMARRDTRWDPYPQRESERPVAHDYYGFWALSADRQWFKSCAGYVLLREITREEAESWSPE